MANLKNITELPISESTENLNLIVNDNGVAKQVPASAVGAQADWNETDETSPAFIMNKPGSISGGGGVVAYGYYGGTWYDKNGNIVSGMTKSKLIEDFMNGVVRFKVSKTAGDEWGTMVGYYYYNYYFNILSTSHNSTTIVKTATTWM